MKGVILGMAVVITAILTICYVGDKWQCSNLAYATGKQTNYIFTSGCYVKLKGEWVPADKWRVID